VIKASPGKLKRCFCFGILGLVVLVALSYVLFIIIEEHYPPDLSRYQQRSLEITAAGGEPLRNFLVDDGLLRLQASLDRIDPRFIEILIAYEDKRFWNHSGVDALAMLRAIWQLLEHRRIISGASTLTMQTARLLNPKGRTLSAKIAEVFFAWQLERRYSKHEILSIYLTLAPYGGNLEGIRAATLSYFGIEPRRLSIDEAALLVALPQSPTRYRPDKNPRAAKQARNKILHRVASHIDINPHDLDLALQAPIPTNRYRLPSAAAHLSQRLFRTQSISKSNLIETNIDAQLQNKINQLAQHQAASVHHKTSVAVLVADLTSRKVLAYVGSAGFGESARNGYVDMVQAIRSPGSTLKPIIYGLAFERGVLHPHTLIRDRPRRFGDYAPHNFRDRHYGQVSAREALQRSLNVPAVAILQKLGPVNFTEHLRQAGMSLILGGHQIPGLAIALGGVGTSLEDLTRLYAAIASDGQYRKLCFRSDCESNDALTLINPLARQQVASILTGVNLPAHLLPERYLEASRGIAFKTGTSYGFRDAWAIGFDAQRVVAVWIGRPDGTPLPGRYGANTAAPLLFQIFDLWPQHSLINASNDIQVHPTVELPPSLKYFDRQDRYMHVKSNTPPPEIVFPPADSVIVVPENGAPLTLSITGGQRPLFWFLNNSPMGESRWSRNISWQVGQAGFHTIVVVDAMGRKSSARVKLQF
jgi:penicillin-binding protein 1C